MIRKPILPGSSNKRKILMSMIIIIGILLLVPAEVIGSSLLQRSRNQRQEKQRIIPLITESEKYYAASRSAGGHTKVTVLQENQQNPTAPGLTAGHGISLLLERSGSSYIFDLGAGDTVLENARLLGKDLSAATAVFISHGHIDHAGALPVFLSQNRQTPVYMSRHAPDNHYRQLLGCINLQTGLTRHCPDLFTANPGRFSLLAKDLQLTSDIYALSGIYGEDNRPAANAGVMKEDSNGRVVPDDFDHELLYVISDPDGLILYSGCCHKGVLNILDTVTRRFPDKPVKAVLGGFHLMNPLSCALAEKPEDVLRLARTLQEKYPATVFYTGHCTGVEGFSLLQSVLGENIRYLATGSTFYIR